MWRSLSKNKRILGNLFQRRFKSPFGLIGPDPKIWLAETAAGQPEPCPSITPALLAVFTDGKAQVAQSVEQRTENPRVGGSIPPLGTS